MTPMQEHILGIMEHFDAFCRAHKLRYFILGGTLLGAVRHRGFIPWDDDADIGMPRSDYERFKLLYDQSGRYFLDWPGLSPDYAYSYAKLYDRETTTVTDNIRPVKRGVWVDIFPLDGTFDNCFLRGFHYLLVRGLKVVVATRHKAFRHNEGFAKRVQRHLILLLLFWVPMHGLHGLLGKVLACRDFDSACLAGNLLGQWGRREIVPRSILGSGCKLSFEEKEFFGPENVEIYLESIYGDYMTPPAEKDRVSDHHLLELDLNEGYDPGWKRH